MTKETLRLWPELGEDAQWQDAVQRRAACGWVEVRGDVDATIEQLGALAVPQLQLEDARKALSDSGAQAPVAETGGSLRLVRATVSVASEGDESSSPAVSVHVRLLATTGWLITWADVDSKPDREALDAAFARVDLSPPVDGDATGFRLGLRVLMGIAEAAGDATGALSGRLDSPGAAGLPDLQSALHNISESCASLRRRSRTPRDAWFPAQDGWPEPAGLADLLDDTVVRGQAAEQEAARREARQRDATERRRGENLQLGLATIAAVLLGPSFIAAAFAAFPGWQPLPHRGAAFIGLSIVSAGTIWLAVYVVPASVTGQISRLGGVLSAAAAVAAVVVGLVLALPLRAGLDERPPDLRLSCPEQARVGAAVAAVVAAADPEGNLKDDPSGVYPVDTRRGGVQRLSYTAADFYGREAAASCLVVIVPPGKP